MSVAMMTSSSEAQKGADAVLSSTPLTPPPPVATEKSIYDKIYDKLCDYDQTIMGNHHEQFFLVFQTATMVETYLDEHVDIAQAFAVNRRQRLAAGIIDLYRLQTLLPTPQIIPMRVGGEDGGQFIHKMITCHPNLYREQLRLPGDLLIELVHIICEKQFMCNGRFIEVAEQVGICLYILSRGASYQETAERIQHSTLRKCLGKFPIMDANTPFSGIQFYYYVQIVE
ncbi:hypothetical protein Cgig2_002055 [Carnegiea gigantea]|uniref:DUF8040 domain-containing protein n=1 Tax=Carnegiea gigantea TaxID=171969 RepID=A0A9Q1JX39_9CARY|nr:hypothetical protein Cgig2_002055 [Carnegiea gigantea]